MDLDVTINEHELDKEWLSQAPMYMDVARKLADAQKDLAEAKNELEVLRAEEELRIRKSPEQYGLSKITEAALKSVVDARTVIAQAKSDVIDAKHACDILNGAVFALDHRKRALENLVNLHLANYYSSPKEPNGDDQEVRKQLKKQRMRPSRERRAKYEKQE